MERKEVRERGRPGGVRHWVEYYGDKRKDKVNWLEKKS